MAEVKGVSVDTDEAYVFAELGMHLRDLNEAVDALETALAFPPPRSLRESRLRSHLLSSAVIAYWRCFSNSNPTRVLSNSLPIPEALQDAHQRSRDWRHQSVAHNDSLTRNAFAFIALRKIDDGVSVAIASTLTVEVAVPDHEVEAFLNLILQIRESVETRMQSQAEQMLSALSDVDLQALWDRPDNAVQFNEATFVWDPSKKRLRSVAEISTPITETSEVHADMWMAGPAPSLF